MKKAVWFIIDKDTDVVYGPDEQDENVGWKTRREARKEAVEIFKFRHFQLIHSLEY
jgi:hypothetical protein